MDVPEEEDMDDNETLELPTTLVGYVDEADAGITHETRLTTRNMADWAMKRLGESRAEISYVEEQLAEAKRRLDQRADEITAGPRRAIAFFEFILAEWAERNKEALLRGKSRSANLLHGSIHWRKMGGRLVVTDPAALSEWLATQPIESGFYRMKLEPEMKALQENCKKTGEVPPGCTYGEEYDSRTIKTEPPELALARKP